MDTPKLPEGSAGKRGNDSELRTKWVKIEIKQWRENKLLGDPWITKRGRLAHMAL